MEMKILSGEEVVFDDEFNESELEELLVKAMDIRTKKLKKEETLDKD